jgi:hypothetical protein
MKFNLNTENINYVKITYKDNNDFAHCIKAAIRLITEHELLACIKVDELPDIKVPQEVSLGIACENGLYKTKTILKKIEEDDAYMLLSMQRPDEVEYQQKREYFRVKIKENVSILYTLNEQNITYSGITYDISAKGVRIELDKVTDFPEEVKLVLYLPQKTINVQAKYIRSDEDDKILKASFQFVNIAQSDLDYVSQVCFRKQLEERRKNFM